MKSALGNRSTSRWWTVSPPTPESNTPMAMGAVLAGPARAVDAALDALTPERQQGRDAQLHDQRQHDAWRQAGLRDRRQPRQSPDEHDGRQRPHHGPTRLDPRDRPPEHQTDAQ